MSQSSETCVTGRYFSVPEKAAADPISGEKPRKLKYYAGGKWQDAKTSKYMNC